MITTLTTNDVAVFISQLMESISIPTKWRTVSHIQCMWLSGHIVNKLELFLHIFYFIKSFYTV